VGSKWIITSIEFCKDSYSRWGWRGIRIEIKPEEDNSPESIILYRNIRSDHQIAYTIGQIVDISINFDFPTIGPDSN
jgi:hypothetical protein